MRKYSNSYKKIVKVKLDSPFEAIYVPAGCAHGFQTLSHDTEVLYYHSNFYNPRFEDGINYKDDELSIKWPLNVKELSPKDLNLQTLNEFEKKKYEM